VTDSFSDFEYKAWQAKAHRYAGSWGKVTSQVIPELIESIPYQTPKENTKILDCGCGPGDLVIAAAADGCNVTGVDFSPEMVEIAQRNIQGIHNAQVSVGDTTSLSFDDGVFDMVFLNYLLLHLADPVGAIEEAARVSRKRVAISLWLAPQNSRGLKLIFDAVNCHADRSVIPPAKDPFSLSDAAVLDELFLQFGFRRLSTKTVNTEWRVQSGVEFFEGVQAGSRLGGMVDLQAPQIKELIKKDILSGVEKFKVLDGFYIPMPSLFYVAEKKE